MTVDLETLYNVRFRIKGYGKQVGEEDPDKISLILECYNTGTEIEIKDMLIHKPYRDRLQQAFKDQEHVQIFITTDFVTETAHQKWIKERENIGQE